LELLGVALGTLLAVMVGVRRIRLAFGSLVSEDIRIGLVLVSGITMGHLTHWSPALWALVPLQAQIFDDYRPRRSRVRLAVFLIGICAVGALDGGGRGAPALVCILSAGIFAVAEARASAYRDLSDEAERRRLEVVEAHARQEAALLELEATHEELKNLYERARGQERLATLGSLAAGLAHEINNPMASVTSNVRSLLEALQKLSNRPVPLNEYVDDVLPETLANVGRVNAIVADLWRLGGSEAEPSTEVNLNDQVALAVRLAASALGDCEVELQLGSLPTIWSRPRQLLRVLVHLLKNAAQASEGRGAILVSSEVRKGLAAICVRDRGIGMGPEVLSKLFRPFYTTRPVGSGMGLGLAVCQGVVLSMAGTIEVESNLGQGSCFTVYLPLEPVPDPTRGPGGHERVAGGNG
jgi:signal transduction histidine kinase